MTGQTSRCGIVAVLGAPNAGKSTLVNRLVGAKVSIVTQKVQTTRARIRGIAMEDGADGKAVQIVYVDTPGIFAPRRALDRAMVQAAWEGAEGTDALILMVDAPSYIAASDEAGKAAARRAAEDTDRIVDGLKEQGLKAILVLNKIDLIPAPPLLKLADRMNAEGVFTDTFMISADKGRGTDDLKRHLTSLMPEGPFLYPEDQLSDISDRLMAAEVTREKLFLRLHQELPYSLTVETEGWSRTKKGELRIEQVVYVEREGQRALVLGRKGHTISTVGRLAREELTELLGETVHLFLFVKVRENWAQDAERFRGLGLEGLPKP
ncbi:GTPase Era [Parvularcula dongshanensis]|uniref:GTPase Era n=1 Tax=Parvularcula dongshanensis TaxID=1173995 RepID=A0A840I266_9PROT|nr:GTPase Era [Parvularcula dongshanensis]MBB4658381.1 GTP-binding protein Era [Parvularcula dongshanensis]